jgi:hypothetical protein
VEVAYVGGEGWGEEGARDVTEYCVCVRVRWGVWGELSCHSTLCMEGWGGGGEGRAHGQWAPDCSSGPMDGSPCSPSPKPFDTSTAHTYAVRADGTVQRPFP